MVEKVTKIQGLFADPELFGAGLHCIPRKGFLNMHVDFNAHPKGWHRRVNVLIYLNESAKFISPLGGRCVIFETNDKSWHGHPLPLACPRKVQRRSLALYLYTKEPPQGRLHTTIYQRG
jgi:hypothetical protein